MKDKNIEFIADRIAITGPRVDGTWKVTFEVGEYMIGSLQELLDLLGTNVVVSVKKYEGN